MPFAKGSSDDALYMDRVYRVGQRRHIWTRSHFADASFGRFGSPTALDDTRAVIDVPEGKATAGPADVFGGRSLSHRRGPHVHFLTTYQLFWMSWASSCFSTTRNPARSRYSRVFSSPHMAPSPSPPCARDTVMQCIHDTV